MILLCPVLTSLPSGDKQAEIQPKPGWRLTGLSIGGNVTYVSTDLRDERGRDFLKKAYVHAGTWYPMSLSMEEKLTLTLATSADVSAFVTVERETTTTTTTGGC